jgi:hypothetical protein
MIVGFVAEGGGLSGVGLLGRLVALFLRLLLPVEVSMEVGEVGELAVLADSVLDEEHLGDAPNVDEQRDDGHERVDPREPVRAAARPPREADPAASSALPVARALHGT